MKLPTSPTFNIVILILANVFWAGSYSAMSYGLQSLPALNMVFWRMVVGGVLILSFFRLRGREWNLSKSDLIRILICGVLQASSHILWTVGLSLSHATDASLLYVFEPIWGIVLATLFLKERLKTITIVSLILAIIGLTRLANFSLAQMSFSDSKVALGNLLITLGGLLEVSFTLVIQPLAKRHPPEKIVGLVLVVTAMILLPFFVHQRGWEIGWSAKSIFAISYLAILCTAYGYVSWVRAMKYVPVNLMYFTLFLQPILGPIIARIFLNEELNRRILEAGIFLLVAMTLATLTHIGERKSMLNAKKV